MNSAAVPILSTSYNSFGIEVTFLTTLLSFSTSSSLIHSQRLRKSSAIAAQYLSLSSKQIPSNSEHVLPPTTSSNFHPLIINSCKDGIFKRSCPVDCPTCGTCKKAWEKTGSRVSISKSWANYTSLSCSIVVLCSSHSCP
jgi:hypothetical protein